MATAKRLPSGQWRARGYYKDPITGKEYRPSFTAASKAEASRMVLEWEAEKERAGRPQEMTVAECIERYIKAKEDTLSPSTIRGYKIMQRNNYAAIENISIKNLTEEDLQIFVSSLCSGHAPKTVKNIYGLLISAISMFSFKKYRVTLPQKQPPELQIPTDKDVKLLMSLALPWMKMCIALAANGTMRAGEIAALKYKDVKPNGVYVHSDMVRNSNNEWVIKNIPKTSASVRFIKLSKKVMRLIGEGDPDSFVLGRTPGAITDAFDRLRDKAGLKCRFHDLRHFAASRMHAHGIPDQYIQERGGWETDYVLKTTYRNTLSDQAQKFQEKANRHFDTLF